MFQYKQFYVVGALIKCPKLVVCFIYLFVYSVLPFIHSFTINLKIMSVPNVYSVEWRDGK